MDTIYNLQQRAQTLRGKTEVDSISPEEVGGLHYDTLAYLANLEQSADSLGIRKVYSTKAAMEADTVPVGTNGKKLRFGQLVVLYDSANPEAETNGDIYAWQDPGWLPVGKISNIYDFDANFQAKIDAEAAARQEADATTIRRLKGNDSGASSAYTDPFIRVEVDDDAAMATFLDTMAAADSGQAMPYTGRVRIFVSGKNVEAEQYVTGWGTLYAQTARGCCRRAAARSASTAAASA